MYLLAIVFPFFAILLSGKPVQAVLNLVLMLTLIGWLPAAVHALFVVSHAKADTRHKQLISAVAR